MTTSTQIREAIIRASRDQGLTYEAIADMLGIGRATVNRILRRKRETGSVAPLPRGGGNWSPLRGEAAIHLRAPVASQADLTAAELATELRRQFGIKTSRSAVQRALARMDYTRKKRSIIAVERDAPANRIRRQIFAALITSVDPQRLVFLDESFCKTGMRREYGRAVRGMRVIGRRPGRSTHKMVAVRAAIEAAGATPVYLPTYSPELNPIELWWCDMKWTLRTLALDAEADLRRAAGRLRACLSIEKIAAWFRFSLRQAQVN